MTPKKIELMDVHAKLAELAYAVNLTLAPLQVGVSVIWRNGTYLSVEVECRQRDSQQVCDRLYHGALADKYDYRFRSVCQPLGRNPLDWVTVSASPDLQHDSMKVRAL